MERKSSFTCILFFVISIILVTGDHMAGRFAINSNLTPVQSECPDLSLQFADSHPVSLEYDDCLNYQRLRSPELSPVSGFISSLNAPFVSHFANSIWQPPKLT